MLTTNPFAELAATLPSGLIQWFLVIMILAVIGGTLFDVIHKQSARYFAELLRRSSEEGAKKLDGSEKTAIAIQTAIVDVATSAEFCNKDRRIAHLLGMYGFILFVLATTILVFSDTGGFWAFMWWIGALMVCGGVGWFWFFIRVDVSAEGAPWHKVMRADLFVLSLLGMAVFGILWAMMQYAGGWLQWPFLLLFLMSTVALFCGVPWSKFAHMFFKPAAAYQKRVANATGQAMGLPTISRDEKDQQERHSMELLKDAPMDMGLGIKREAPNHY